MTIFESVRMVCSNDLLRHDWRYWRERALLRTIDHLTCAEIHRLVHRYDLNWRVADLLCWKIGEQIDYAQEIRGEQLAERGWTTREKHPMEVYLERNPLYTCEPRYLCACGSGQSVQWRDEQCNTCDPLPF